MFRRTNSILLHLDIIFVNLILCKGFYYIVNIVDDGPTSF